MSQVPGESVPVSRFDFSVRDWWTCRQCIEFLCKRTGNCERWSC